LGHAGSRTQNEYKIANFPKWKGDPALMSGFSLPQSWKEFRSALADYAGILALFVWILTVVSWITDIIPMPLVWGLAGFAGAFSVIGIVGQVLVSGGQGLTTIGSLVPARQGGSRRNNKPIPKSNLTFLGVEYVNLYVDENDVYWEIRRGGNRQDQPSFSAVLRFGNEPITGHPGQPIRGLRASLTFRDAKTGRSYPPIDRGAWAREKYNAINLEVGDSRLLIVGFGMPPGYKNPGFVFAVSNNSYAESNPRPGDLVVHKIDSPRLEVDVRLVAGDAGLILYEDSFELCTEPQLAFYAKE
jgi:hypothetical protein